MRLVATDLDGTIVQRDGSVSPRTVAALGAVERSGRHLVLVTGRPPRWMAPVVAATGHRGRAICANGAYVYDLRTEQVLESFLLAPSDALEVVRRLRALMPDVSFALETDRGFGESPATRPAGPRPTTTPSRPSRSWSTGPSRSSSPATTPASATRCSRWPSRRWRGSPP